MSDAPPCIRPRHLGRQRPVTWWNTGRCGNGGLLFDSV